MLGGLPTELLLLILGLVALRVVLIAWTYTDAQEHAEEYATVWSALILISPAIGLGLYLCVARLKGAVVG